MPLASGDLLALSGVRGGGGPAPPWMTDPPHSFTWVRLFEEGLRLSVSPQRLVLKCYHYSAALLSALPLFPDVSTKSSV